MDNMTYIKIETKDLPRDLALTFPDPNGKAAHRFYTDEKLDQVWDYIFKQLYTMDRVQLLIVGYLPYIAPARYGVRLVMMDNVDYFATCVPGGVVQVVFDKRLEYE
jgi:hypothetical protein